MVITLSKALIGTASQWLAHICFPGMSWPKFKQLFLSRHEGVEMPAPTFLNILKGRPNENESLSVYGRRLVTSLVTKWKVWTKQKTIQSVGANQMPLLRPTWTQNSRVP